MQHASMEFLAAVAKMLHASGLHESAWRENRKRERIQKRWDKYSSYRMKPHGDRECARRRRQIAAGQLTVSNGLVA
jgi:hypothetical protein